MYNNKILYDKDFSYIGDGPEPLPRPVCYPGPWCGTRGWPRGAEGAADANRHTQVRHQGAGLHQGREDPGAKNGRDSGTPKC